MPAIFGLRSRKFRRDLMNSGTNGKNTVIEERRLLRRSEILETEELLMKKNNKMKMRKILSSIIATAMSISMFTGIPVSAEIGRTKYNYDGYSVDYNVTNEWDGAQTVEVTISNTGSSSILNWSLKYDAEGEISNLWNAEIYKQSTDEYVIKNANWNYKIDPSQSVTYGYTLNGTNYSKPDSFEINSKRIARFKH